MRKSLYVTIIILSIFGVLVPAHAQDETETPPPPSVEEFQVYVCVVAPNDNAASNLVEVTMKEPIGLMFSEPVAVAVYSDPNTPIVADVFDVTSDTDTGTYRRIGDVVRGANTTSNASLQENCEDVYPEQLVGLNRTIVLPVSTDQSLAVQHMDKPIDYESEGALIIGAFGLQFRETQTALPDLQLLRFRGGLADVVSLKFHDVQEEIQLYLVAARRNSYTTTERGDESESKILDRRELLVIRLFDRDEDIIQDIMSPSNFRFFIGFGERISYASGDVLNIRRPSEFGSRGFQVEDRVVPIDCPVNEDEPQPPGEIANIPYFRQNEYSHYNYFIADPPELYDSAKCDDPATIAEIREDGILIVAGEFAIAAWLVRPE